MKAKIILAINISVSVLLFMFFFFIVEEGKKVNEEYKELKTMQIQLDETSKLIEQSIEDVNYRIEYLDVIYRVAECYGIEPELALAMMKVESNFKVDAVNKGSGCAGLMQVSPIHNVANVLDLRNNIECSFSLISYLQNEYEDLNTVLGSYSMGEAGYRRYVSKTNQKATAYTKKITSLLSELKGE